MVLLLRCTYVEEDLLSLLPCLSRSISTVIIIRSVREGPWNVPSEAVSLVVKKFPRISSLSVHRLEGWASFSKKKTDEKEQFLSGLRPKVKFLSGQVNWTLRAHF